MTRWHSEEGSGFAQFNKLDLAIWHYEQGLAKGNGPDVFNVNYLLGRLYARAGRGREAVKSLEASIEVWTKGGLATFYLLFVMELKSRRVHYVGCTTTLNEAWVKQAGNGMAWRSQPRCG